MKKRDSQPDADPLKPDANEALANPTQGASDSTLIILLAAVIALLLICIVFVLVAS